jgi:hypothetical protein
MQYPCLVQSSKLFTGKVDAAYLLLLLNLVKLSLQITCPHGIIIGGFCAVACSLLTGQANTL